MPKLLSNEYLRSEALSRKCYVETAVLRMEVCILICFMSTLRPQLLCRTPSKTKNGRTDEEKRLVVRSFVGPKRISILEKVCFGFIIIVPFP